MSKLTAVNSNDKDWTRNRYVIALGAYGWTRLLVWANSLDDAIEECAEWCADNAPGLLCDSEVAEEYERALAAAKMDESLTDEQRQEIAWGESTVDTIVCDQGHYFHSWEVHLMHENPTRDQLLDLTGNPEKNREIRKRKSMRAGRIRLANGRLLLTQSAA